VASEREHDRLKQVIRSHVAEIEELTLKNHSEEAVEEMKRRLQDLEVKYDQDTKEIMSELRNYKQKCYQLEKANTVLTERKMYPHVSRCAIDFYESTADSKQPTPANIRYSSCKDNFDSREMSENKQTSFPLKDQSVLKD
jgi:DNA repair ATPase RecN